MTTLDQLRIQSHSFSVCHLHNALQRHVLISLLSLYATTLRDWLPSMSPWYLNNSMYFFLFRRHRINDNLTEIVGVAVAAGTEAMNTSETAAKRDLACVAHSLGV